MDSGIVNAWDSFSEAVRRLYRGDLDRGALGAEVDEPALEAVADRSAELTNAIGAAVRVKRSEEKVEAALQGEGEVDQRMLEGELGKLGRHYGKNMRWSRRLATAMKWLGLPVIALTGGAPGAIALAGASGVGLTYVLFSLAGRLETLPAPVQRVHGVPTVVLDCMS